MTNQQVAGLIDDLGVPVRWKAATVLSLAAFIITLAIAIGNAGAKSERLETVARELKELKALPSKVDRLEAWKDDVSRRLANIEDAQKEILKEQREILREVRRR